MVWLCACGAAPYKRSDSCRVSRNVRRSLPFFFFSSPPQNMSLLRRRLATVVKDPPLLRITVAGGGIAGCILASQLAGEPGVRVNVYEQRCADELPAGLNLLLNHNGMAALRDSDQELEAAVRGRGHDVVGWSARTMAGRILYDLENVQAEGLADLNGVMARWDEVNAVCQRAAWSRISWGHKCTGYDYVTRGADAGVCARLSGEGDTVEADLLVGADGRYSAVREHMEGGKLPEPRFGPIATFRTAVAEDALPREHRGLVAHIQDCMRVYNTPDVRSVEPGGRYARALGEDDEFVKHCMRGLARAGVLRIRPPPLADGTLNSSEGSRLGVWGNVTLPPSCRIPEAAKTAEGFDALFTPREGVEALEGIGKLVHHVLTHHAADAHWVRQQETDQRIVDDGGRVLLVGDSAGAIYPSLGQGANLAIEDACQAAAVLKIFVREARAAGACRIDVPAATHAIASLRAPRRNAVASISREHTFHFAASPRGGDFALAADAADWLGTDGGHFESGVWRARLRELWSGWQSIAVTEAAVTDKARRAARALAQPDRTPTHM